MTPEVLDKRGLLSDNGASRESVSRQSRGGTAAEHVMTDSTIAKYIPLRNILLTTDFSEPSNRAASYAFALARRHDATIHVAHVLIPPKSCRDTQVGICDNITQRELEQYNLEAWVASCLGVGVRCRSVLCEGALGEWLACLVKDLQADLVILGTKGPKTWLSFGSQAEQIFLEAPCPVLTIGPRVSANRNSAFKQILFTTDLMDASMRAYPYVVKFAAENNGRITVLHVVGFSSSAFQYDPAIADRLRSLLSAFEQPLSTDIVVSCGDPLTIIMHYARDLATDLIVMGVEHALALEKRTSWALTRRVVRDASCPVLTIRF